MRFITFNAIRDKARFKLTIPVDSIIYGFSLKEVPNYHIMIKGSEYGGFGDVLSINDNIFTKIDLVDDTEIELLSKIKK